jgi:hypothetical protein
VQDLVHIARLPNIAKESSLLQQQLKASIGSYPSNPVDTFSSFVDSVLSSLGSQVCPEARRVCLEARRIGCMVHLSRRRDPGPMERPKGGQPLPCELLSKNIFVRPGVSGMRQLRAEGSDPKLFQYQDI